MLSFNSHFRFLPEHCVNVFTGVDTRANISKDQGAVLLTVGRSYVGNDVTHSTLLDRAGVSNTAPWVCADVGRNMYDRTLDKPQAAIFSPSSRLGNMTRAIGKRFSPRV